MAGGACERLGRVRAHARVVGCGGGTARRFHSQSRDGLARAVGGGAARARGEWVSRAVTWEGLVEDEAEVKRREREREDARTRRRASASHRRCSGFRVERRNKEGWQRERGEDRGEAGRLQRGRARVKQLKSPGARTGREGRRGKCSGTPRGRPANGAKAACIGSRHPSGLLGFCWRGTLEAMRSLAGVASGSPPEARAIVARSRERERDRHWSVERRVHRCRADLPRRVLRVMLVSSGGLPSERELERLERLGSLVEESRPGARACAHSPGQLVSRDGDPATD